jgi:chaperonin GroES
VGAGLLEAGGNRTQRRRIFFSGSSLHPNGRRTLEDGVNTMKVAVKVRPLHDRIIVQRIEEGEQKVGGIIIPDTAKEKPQQGKVVAVGAGKQKDDGKRIALDVKEGDTILFGKYSGQEIKLDGEELLIMREDEVLAILDK